MQNPNLLSPMGVSLADLVVGGLYFSVAYADNQCLVPVIESLVYVGRNLDGDDESALFFQDAVSYHEFGVYPDIEPDESSSGRIRIIVTAGEPPPNLFELPGALDELSRCQARRNLVR